MNNKHFHRPRTTSKVVRGRRKTLEKELFIVGLAFILGHILGTFQDWYDNLLLFDNIVHFTAGVWVTLVFFAMIPSLEDIPWRKKILFAGGFALIIGVAWELFEFTVENYYLINFQGPPLDTLTDLIIDTIGGISAALYIKFYN